MVTETDDRGRVYLSKKLRERHGEQFRVVDRPGRIVLIPVDKDPLAAVREAVGDAFAGKSATELKDEALGAAREEVDAEIRDREQRQHAADNTGREE